MRFAGRLNRAKSLPQDDGRPADMGGNGRRRGRHTDAVQRVMREEEAGEPIEARLRRALGLRSIVLVGLMGAGKSTVGRRLASRLGLIFKDADLEIEAAAGLTIPDIFAIYGEPSFRDGEARVISRLLRAGPLVLATGGGAYLRESTRMRISESAVSVWLKADLDVLMRRVRKRGNRPLLQTDDPEATMRDLMAVRHPIYAAADVMVISREVSHDRVVQDVLEALDAHLNGEPPVPIAAQ